MKKQAPRKGNRRRPPASRKPNSKRPEKPKNEPKQASLFSRAKEAIQTWASQNRPLLRGLGIGLLGVAGVITFVLLGQQLQRFARSAAVFSITEVAVEGNERLDALELQRIAGTVEGSNIFAVPPEEAMRRLVNHPWIKSAQVSRELPHKVHFKVEEHRPVAVLVLEKLYLVGESANLFREVSVDDPVDLPFITGVEPQRFSADASYRSSMIGESVALLHDYRQAGLWRAEPISEIHFERDGGMSLYIGADSTHVRLGRQPYRSKLRQLRDVFDRLRAQKERPAYVYLDNIRRPDRVTVRLR